MTNATSDQSRQYDVCLSYAGEQRDYVEAVARALLDQGIRVFYDAFERDSLWGKDLYEHLDWVYSHSAKYCIAFFSEDYAKKLWTTHERRSAQARALQEGREYVLPVRFDDTEIPGLRPSIAYEDARRTSPEEIASLVRQKLGGSQRANISDAKKRDAITEIASGYNLFDLIAPGDLLEAVLTRAYGTKDGIEDIVTSLLGGPGRRLDGSDTAAGHNVTTCIRLASGERPGTCRSEVDWAYEFPGMRNNHKFVIFGTHDRELASQVVDGRVFPLFELWLLEDEDAFDDFYREVQDSVQIGITYVDDDQATHVVEPRSHHGRTVSWRNLSEFIRVPDSSNLGRLIVIEFDLFDLADDDHYVKSIEKLTLRVSNTARNSGWFTWAVPFPCYVERVVFDPRDLDTSQGPFEYSIGVASPGLGLNALQDWRQVLDTLDIPIGGWMMSGQTVTILWRQAATSEPAKGTPNRR
jgi:hypothetical protein